MPEPEFYAQLSVATGARTVYLSGQVARDAQGGRVGTGDLAAQVAQAYLDVATALTAVGGSVDDAAKLTLCVVDWDESKPAALGEGVGRAAERLGVSPLEPTTLLGVAALGEPDLLVEVEAVGVLP